MRRPLLPGALCQPPWFFPGSSFTPHSRCALLRLSENPHPWGILDHPTALLRVPLEEHLAARAAVPHVPYDMDPLEAAWWELQGFPQPCVGPQWVSQCLPMGGDPPAPEMPGPALAQAPGFIAMRGSWHKGTPLPHPQSQRSSLFPVVHRLYRFPFLAPNSCLPGYIHQEEIPTLPSITPRFLELPQVLKGVFLRKHF